METVRKYGGDLSQGRNRGDIMAEKIQRSRYSCLWELRFLLISSTNHEREVRRRPMVHYKEPKRRRKYYESRHQNGSCQKKK